MKKWFLHILLLAGLFGMLTTSCSQEEDLDSQASDKKVQVMFTIAMDGQSARSRATWGSDYDNEIGDNFDNKINPDQLFVKLTLTDDKNNTFTKDVQNIVSWQVTNGGNEYRFVGEVPVAITTTTTYATAKIEVYANVDKGDEDFGIDYSIGSGYPGIGVEYIPMWGVKTISNLFLEPGSMTDLGESNPICLLRSMAKVEVIMKAEDHEISAISINRYNNTGYCAPTGYGDATETLALNRNSAFRATSSINTGSVAFINNVTEVTEGSNTYKCYTIYVPEYDNLSTGVTPSTISIQVDNKDKVYTINHGTAGINPEYNIVRNHIYRYNITKVNDGVSLAVTCQVQPWDLQQQVIDYTSEPAAAEGGEISWIGATPDASNQVALNADLEAQCSFTLNSPLGYQWVASLVPVGDGASAANSPFRFVVDDEVSGMDTSGIIDGRPVTLTIKSTATDGVDEDKVVRLQIIVIKGDGTSVILDEDVIGGPYTIIHTK